MIGATYRPIRFPGSIQELNLSKNKITDIFRRRRWIGKKGGCI